jgi:hypothetical protein
VTLFKGRTVILCTMAYINGNDNFVVFAGVNDDIFLSNSHRDLDENSMDFA